MTAPFPPAAPTPPVGRPLAPGDAPIPPPLLTAVYLLHLSPLLLWLLPGVGGVVGAALAWLLLRGRDPLLDRQGRAVLNFQVSLWLYSLAVGAAAVLLSGLAVLAGLIGAGEPGGPGGALGVTLSFWVFGLLAAGLAALFLYLLQLVTLVLALARTSQGFTYRYPLTLHLLR